MKLTLGTLLLTLFPAQTLRIPASRDNTLIESPSGSLSNGAGPTFYVGRTNQPRGSIRRAVLRFELAGALPSDAIVERVRLSASASATHLRAHDVHVHRLFQDWGEGSSLSFGGIGAPSQPGDATWIHSSYPGVFWPKPGGRFSPRASAWASVKGSGTVVWESPSLIRDVVEWQRNPLRNFGWILLGNETLASSVTQFESREAFVPARRPVLEISYKRIPGSPLR